jgi:predicted nucleic acid-binding protein
LKRGYVDTSVLLAIAFTEPNSAVLEMRLASYDQLHASPLLEAELASALRREGLTNASGNLLAALRFLHPQRRLTAELETTNAAGQLRGADLFHLASALFVAPNAEIVFLSLDTRQREVAAKLGFEVEP